jgi:hypothetical protein
VTRAPETSATSKAVVFEPTSMHAHRIVLTDPAP